MKAAMTAQFLSAMADMDGADARRVAAFLDRLIRDPAGSPAAEIVHDAGDRSVRAMRVTRDLRAIVCLEEDRVVLLHVAHHDDAFRWAREHCVRCGPDGDALEVLSLDVKRVEPPAPPEAPPRVECIVEDGASLCEVLDARGIPHEVTP